MFSLPDMTVTNRDPSEVQVLVFGGCTVPSWLYQTVHPLTHKHKPNMHLLRLLFHCDSLAEGISTSNDLYYTDLWGLGAVSPHPYSSIIQVLFFSLSFIITFLWSPVIASVQRFYNLQSSSTCVSVPGNGPKSKQEMCCMRCY